MQNLGVNVFSFLFVSIYLFLVPRSINYVFIISFASLRTLYEPSSETQILTMVYNNTLIAKEMFKLSFFLSAMRFSTRLGRLFQTCSFKTAKTGFNRFCPCYQK